MDFVPTCGKSTLDVLLTIDLSGMCVITLEPVSHHKILHSEFEIFREITCDKKKTTFDYGQANFDVISS